jgi:hypothetical protein
LWVIESVFVSVSINIGVVVSPVSCSDMNNNSNKFIVIVVFLLYFVWVLNFFKWVYNGRVRVRCIGQIILFFSIKYSLLGKRFHVQFIREAQVRIYFLLHKCVVVKNNSLKSHYQNVG